MVLGKDNGLSAVSRIVRNGDARKDSKKAGTQSGTVDKQGFIL